ncbi:MAG: hypothetical protein ACLR4W_03105 [Oscillospiraceae bacterium]
MYLLVTGFYAFLSHLDYLYAAVAAYLCGCFNGALFTSRLFFTTMCAPTAAATRA